MAAVAVASHFAWHQGAGGNECDKVGEGWIWLDDMEMLEARVAGANFQMFDVSFLW